MVKTQECAQKLSVAALVFVALFLGDVAVASDTGSGAKVIALEQTRLVGEFRLKSIDVNSFTETLRFILSSEPGLDVVPQSTTPWRPSGVFGLSGTLRQVGSSVVWVGELSRPDGTGARVGPVSLLDESGLRAGALPEVVALVKAYVHSPIQGGKIRVAFGCFDIRGKAAAIVRDYFFSQMEKQSAKQAIVYEKGDDSACSDSPRAGLLTGMITIEAEVVEIVPMAKWQGLQVPLPVLRATVEEYSDWRDEYFGVLASAVEAVVARSSYELLKEVEGAHLSADHDYKRQTGLRLINSKEYYLGVALLQQTTTNSRAELEINIGETLLTLKAPRLAEARFRAAIAQKDLPEAHRELGDILLAKGKLDEAAGEYKLAKGASGARGKYALVNYLLGDRTTARSSARDAIKEGDPSAELPLMLVRIALEDENFQEAIDLLQTALGTAGSSLGLVQAVKETAATAAAKCRWREAETALRIIWQRDRDDPEVYVLMGRIVLNLAAANDFDSRLKEVTDHFRFAHSFAQDPQRQWSPELQTVPLELAEAYFLNGDYSSAAVTALDFLNRTRHTDKFVPDVSGLQSYQPVALLLVAAARYLAGQIGDEVREQLEKDISGYSTWPTLYLSISPSSGKSWEIPISRWSFDIFEQFVQEKLSQPQQTLVLELARNVQRKIGGDVRGLEKKKEGC